MDFELVWKVFDKDLQLRFCGRDNCIKLINHLSSIYPDKDFGNKNTGFLNLRNVREVIRKEMEV